MLCLLWGGIAHAQTRFSLSYSAPEACPSERDFLDHVLRRTQRAILDPTHPDARGYTVTITQGEVEFEGELRMQDRGEPVRIRRLQGETCEELVSGISLVVALSIDPDALMDLAAPAESPALPPPPPAPVPEPPPTDSSYWLMGARARGMTGIAPETAFGAAAHLGWMASGRWRPSFRVGFDAVFANSTDLGAGNGSFRLTASTAEGCPAAIGLADDLDVHPCIGLSVGSLRGEGEGIVRPETSESLWVASDLTLRLDWRVASVIHLEAQGGLLLPWTRTRFVFHQPTTVAYEVPSAAATFSLGASVFW